MRNVLRSAPRAVSRGQKTVRQDKCPQKEISGSEAHIFFHTLRINLRTNTISFIFTLFFYQRFTEHYHADTGDAESGSAARGHSVLSLSDTAGMNPTK